MTASDAIRKMDPPQDYIAFSLARHIIGLTEDAQREMLYCIQHDRFPEAEQVQRNWRDEVLAECQKANLAAADTIQRLTEENVRLMCLLPVPSVILDKPHA